MTARLNGRDLVRLLLDTGDPGGVTLDESRAAALGLSPGKTDEQIALHLGGPRRTPVRRSRLETIDVDGQVWRDQEVLLAPAAAGFEAALGGRIDGFLGTRLLRDMRLVIDYPARRLCLSPGGGPAPPSAASTRLDLRQGRVFTTVLIDGAEARAALVDTAAAATLVDARLGAAAGGSGPDLALVDGAGSLLSGSSRELRSLALGGAVFQNVPAAGIDLRRRLASILPAAGPSVGVVIGADLLSRQRVVLDFARGRLSLDPGRASAGSPHPAP